MSPQLSTEFLSTIVSSSSGFNYSFQTASISFNLWSLWWQAAGGRPGKKMIGDCSLILENVDQAYWRMWIKFSGDRWLNFWRMGIKFSGECGSSWPMFSLSTSWICAEWWKKEILGKSDCSVILDSVFFEQILGSWSTWTSTTVQNVEQPKMREVVGQKAWTPVGPWGAWRAQ